MGGLTPAGRLGAKPPPIILDSQQHRAVLNKEAHLNIPGARVLLNIVEGLLEDTEKIKLNGGRKAPAQPSELAGDLQIGPGLEFLTETAAGHRQPELVQFME